MLVTLAYISPDKKTKIVFSEPTEGNELMRRLAKMLALDDSLPMSDIYNLIKGEVRQRPVSSDYKYELQLVSEFDGYL